MTLGVCQRFPRRQRWVERLVDPLNAIRLDPPGDGQGFTQEPFRTREEREGIAVELSIVQKLRAVDAPKTSDTEQTLRHLRLDALGVTEQHHGRAAQDPVPEQPQAAQQLSRFLGPWVL